MPKSLTPRQLVQLTLFGTLLLMVAYAMDFLPFRSAAEHAGFWVGLWAYRLTALEVLVFLAGVVIIWRSYKRLSDGLRLEQWNEAQLDSARAISNSPVLLWCGAVILLVSLSMLIAAHLFRFHLNAVVLMYSVYPISLVSGKLRKPKPSRTPVDWHANKPFFSSHWGGPPAAH